MSEQKMKLAVSFNPHWVGNSPAWDIRLLNGDIHRSVTTEQIRQHSSRVGFDCVRECDIQDFGKATLKQIGYKISD